MSGDNVIEELANEGLDSIVEALRILQDSKTSRERELCIGGIVGGAAILEAARAKADARYQAHAMRRLDQITGLLAELIEKFDE